MESSQLDAKSEPKPNRIPTLFVMVFVVLAVCGAAALWLNRESASQPQLDIRNIGSKPVLIRHRGNDLVIRSGDVGALRFSPGDTLKIFAGETAAGQSKDVQLEKRGPDQGTTAAASRVAAEVNADDEANIAFRYSDGI